MVAAQPNSGRLHRRRLILGTALALVAVLGLASLPGCSHLGAGRRERSQTIFELAMIPDTQNYVDYTHQRAEGFVFDASHLLMEQMRWIASRSRARGGEIAFVAAVGDVWQHQSLPIDEEHAKTGEVRARHVRGRHIGGDAGEVFG